MKELSMHILDLVQNSIVANATEIIINVIENHLSDNILIEIIDNGIGISKNKITEITNPFVTQRLTRRVGLGIPLIKHAAEMCDGNLTIESIEGEGTKVKVYFRYSHIDRAPLGNMAETLIILIAANPEIDFIHKYSVNNKEFIIDTKEIKKHIQDIKINNMEILEWIKEYINDGIQGVLK